MQVEQTKTPVTIGYYPFRAKAQVLRLICEYAHVPYKDHFYDPDQWRQQKLNFIRQNRIAEFPYLQHDGFVLTGGHAMLTYVVQISGKLQLLGRTLEHRTKIDMFKMKGNLQDIILGFINSSRQSNDHEESQKRRGIKEFFENKILHLMEHHEEECMAGQFYFGYLTIIDFSVYQIVSYFKRLFPKEINRFPKLLQLKNKVGAIPEIKAYEMSSRKVSQYCPIRYFNRYKELKLRTMRLLNSRMVQTTTSEMKEQ